MDFINKMLRGDRVIWIIFIILGLISFVEVYSATSTLTFHTDYLDPIMRHTTFLLGGILIVMVVHAVNPKYFSILGICLPLACLLLIATRLFGKPINGAYRWIQFAGVSFQPLEIAKLCLVVFTAFILSKRKDNKNDKSFNWICIATAITCVILVRDNGSTTLMLVGIIFLLMFVGQIPVFKETGLFILGVIKGFVFTVLFFVSNEGLQKTFPKALKWKKNFRKHFVSFALFMVFLGGMVCLVYFSSNGSERSDTRRNRVADFFWEVKILRSEKEIAEKGEFKITDKNFQSAHACIAIANGGVFGKMPGNGRERHVLPQAYSDFIYAIIIEEMGLIGGIVVLFLYLVLFIRAGIIANRCKGLFPKYLVIGSAMVLVVQALSNMAVAVHLIPVTGQPMPLVSRGGTSTLINCIYIGIILSVSRFDNPRGVKREDEISRELEEEALEAEAEAAKSDLEETNE